MDNLQQRMDLLSVREEDLEERFILGSGSGGQKINKTSSCVYLRHVPTGIEVRCQQERSQALNRFIARRELCQKIETLLLGKKSADSMARYKIKKQKARRSRRSKDKMVADKRKKAEIKAGRTRKTNYD